MIIKVNKRVIKDSNKASEEEILEESQQWSKSENNAIQSINSKSELKKEDQTERDKLILILFNEIINQIKDFSVEKIVDFEVTTANWKSLEDSNKSMELFENFKSRLINSSFTSHIEYNWK